MALQAAIRRIKEAFFALRRSLCFKLTLVFVLLLLVVGVFQFHVVAQYAERYYAAAEQQTNLGLAATLKRKFEPCLKKGINRLCVKQAITESELINRRAVVYLLDRNGIIQTAFHEEQSVPRPFVRLEPIRAFLSRSKLVLPLYGEDPLDLKQDRPFSVAEINAGNEKGYLYVVLGSLGLGSQSADADRQAIDSYLKHSAARALMMVLGIAALIGAGILFVLTRRLHTITAAVQAFEKGDYTKRAPAGSQDEVGRLGVSFNHLADTIKRNLETIADNDNRRRELIAGISHDVRKPLTSVQGYIETILLKYGQLNDEERKSYISIALRNINQATQLVEQLFELAKLDAVDRSMQRKPFDLFELAENAVQRFMPAAVKQGVSLQNKVPENWTALGDASLIERAVSNLIDNSIRHTPKGGTVGIKASRSGGRIMLAVEDTGDGIAAEDLLHIFERFFSGRGKNAKDSNGSGLGLAIVKKIAELHGSKVQVKSTVNVGTTVAFDLDGAAEI